MVLKFGGAAKTLLKAGMLPTAVVVLIATVPHAYAGVISIGQPTVEEGQYTFPIGLEGADNLVTALDFRVQFDPQVFQPVSAVAGNAALAGNKMVTANYSSPGQYVVVMMGFNQTTVPGGQVAAVMMQRVGGGSDAPTTQVSIADPTLSKADGTELPVSGTSIAVPLGGGKSGSGEGSPEGETTTPTETPATPAPAASGDTAAQVPKAATPAAQRPGGMAPGVGIAPKVSVADGSAAGTATTPVTAASTPKPEAAKMVPMPIVPGSEAPAPAAAKMAVAANSISGGEKLHNNGVGGSKAATPATSTAAIETIESSRQENKGTAAAALKGASSGQATSEGNGTVLYVVIAGAGAAVLLIAGVFLKKLSSR